MDFREAFDLLNILTEDTDTVLPEQVPPEILELIAAGVPLYKETPEFLQDECSNITESIWPYKSLEQHYDKHRYVPSQLNPEGKQDLHRLENADKNFSYLFPTAMTLDEYKKRTEDLVAAEVGPEVGCFICQDPRHLTTVVDGQKQRLDTTSKFNTGETRADKNSIFRICKYRLNLDLKIPASNLFYRNPNGNIDQHPERDFIYADHGICEVVYYTYTNNYDRNNNFAKSSDTYIQSYFLKDLEK